MNPFLVGPGESREGTQPLSRPSGLTDVAGILWTSLLTECYVHDLTIIILPTFMVRQLQVDRGFIENVLCWK